MIPHTPGRTITLLLPALLIPLLVLRARALAPVVMHVAAVVATAALVTGVAATVAIVPVVVVAVIVVVVAPLAGYMAAVSGGVVVGGFRSGVVRLCHLLQILVLVELHGDGERRSRALRSPLFASLRFAPPCNRKAGRDEMTSGRYQTLEDVRDERGKGKGKEKGNGGKKSEGSLREKGVLEDEDPFFRPSVFSTHFQPRIKDLSHY